MSGDAVLWRHNKSKMADGTATILVDGHHFHHISVKNHSILLKFSKLQQILNLMTVTWPKIEILKIQDGGDRHLENRFYGHNSSTDCPIIGKQNVMPTKATWQKLQIFTIQDGGRQPFWKSFNHHMSVKKKIIMRFWQNLLYYSGEIWEWEWYETEWI